MSTSIPHNIDAEEAVVGAMIINPDIADEIEMETKDFYIDRNRWVYDAIRTVRARGDGVDVMTISEELDRKGRLEDVGGVPRLLALANATPLSYNAPSYAKMVTEQAVRRDLIRAANEIAQLAYNQGLHIDEVVSEVSQEVAKVTGRTAGTTRLIGEVAAERYGYVEFRMDGGPETFIPMDLADVQARMGGYRPGRFYVVAGRPGQGKTTLLLQDALHAASQGFKVYFSSLEMSNEEVTDRMLSYLSGIPYSDIERGDVVDMNALYRASKTLEAYQIHLDDTPAVTPHQFRARVGKLVSRGECDIAFLDYIQLMNGKGHNRVEEVSDITRNLKLIARELGIPVASASQENRAPEGRVDGRPRLADLRESGSIEQDADVVMFIWQDPVKYDTMFDKHVATLLIEKNRGGPVGQVDVTFTGAMFRDLAPRY